MEISKKALDLLEKWEGVILHAYPDRAGKMTIGAGHLLTPSELKSGVIVIKGIKVNYEQGLTFQQALDLKEQDITPRQAEVNRLVKVPLTQNQFDAIVIFAFNIGIEGFATSSALAAINQKLFDQVPHDMRKWNEITDPKTRKRIVCEGLVRRREKEIALWNGAYQG